MDFKKFLAWEKATNDTIDVKRTYMKMADDVLAGLMLSQIVYWYLPADNGGSKLQVKKDGHFWIAKSHEEWHEEIFFSRSNVDTAYKKLLKKNLIIKSRYKFNGAPTVHIRLNIPVFLELLLQEVEMIEQCQTEQDQEFAAYLEAQSGTARTEGNEAEALGQLDLSESSKSICRNPTNPFAEIQQIHLRESSKSLTESTAKNLSKTTNKESFYLSQIEDDIVASACQYHLDRLTEPKVKVLNEVVKDYRGVIDDRILKLKIRDVMKSTVKKSFKGLLITALDNAVKETIQAEQQRKESEQSQGKGSKFVRVEELAESVRKAEEEQPVQKSPEEIAEQRRKLEEALKQYKKEA